MNQLQSKLYTLLTEIDEICARNQITYYLAAGCSLGAVRHGGFLPWDDDVDIYITRDNWEKLCRVMPGELKENRDFITNENTEYYCNPIGRYVDKETTFMLRSQVICGKCCGLIIEFFVMDPMPEDPDAQWEHRRNMKVYAELLSPYFVLNKNTLTKNVDFDIDLYDECLKKTEKEGREAVLAELKEKFTQTPEEGCAAFCMRWGQRSLMYPAHMFGEPKYVRFEDRDFPLVGKPEETFRIAYGDDWMFVPPTDGMITHNSSLDLNEPFEKFVEMYMPRIDQAKIFKAYEHRKTILMENLKSKDHLNQIYGEVKADLYAERIRSRYSALAPLEEALKSRDLDALGELLEEYFLVQNDPFLGTSDTYVETDEDLLYLAMMYYIYAGNYHKAGKLLAKRNRRFREPVSERVQKAADAVEFCRNLSIQIFDMKDRNKVRELLASGTEYSDIIDYSKAELWLSYEEAKEKNDEAAYERLQKQAESALKIHGADGELERFAAYALYGLGRKEEAKALYERAVNDTRNGFVWKEAKELFGIVPKEEIYENE